MPFSLEILIVMKRRTDSHEQRTLTKRRKIDTLSLRDELDAGTGYRISIGVLKIIGGYCGVAIHTNLLSGNCRLESFLHKDDMQANRGASKVPMDFTVPQQNWI